MKSFFLNVFCVLKHKKSEVNELWGVVIIMILWRSIETNISDIINIIKLTT